ncbi:MAG TPA: gamma-glutamyl-gamma-aminobutyrate hydrolase family protein, partial [Candidatus Berkiella sp.]|nr:gamma-glutamyl-gamma-aminobutyrate hydrolase family protein [Candidatus Berkiella sp.]
DGPIHGPSYHHQAVKDVAPTLEVVATYNGVIKATQATDGSKVMLCQFHPEYEYDKNSENILNQFMGISAENKILSKVIEISDIVDFGTPLDKILVDEPVLPAQTQNISTTVYNYFASFVPSFFTETIQTEISVI